MKKNLIAFLIKLSLLIEETSRQRTSDLADKEKVRNYVFTCQKQKKTIPLTHMNFVSGL